MSAVSPLPNASMHPSIPAVPIPLPGISATFFLTIHPGGQAKSIRGL